MALRIFSRWIELYCGPDQNHYDNLVALLDSNDIEHKTATLYPPSQLATYAGAASCAPTTTFTRVASIDPVAIRAMKEEEEPAEPTRYRIHIRACDRKEVHRLQAQIQ